MDLSPNRIRPGLAARILGISAAAVLVGSFLTGCANRSTDIVTYESARSSAELKARHTNEGYARMQESVEREARRVTRDASDALEQTLAEAGDNQARVSLAWIAYHRQVDTLRAWYENETATNEDWRQAGMLLAQEPLRQYEFAQQVFAGMTETGRYFAERGMTEVGNIIEAAHARNLAREEEKARRREEREKARRDAEAAAHFEHMQHELAERERALREAEAAAAAAQ